MNPVCFCAAVHDIAGMDLSAGDIVHPHNYRGHTTFYPGGWYAVVDGQVTTPLVDFQTVTNSFNNKSQ